MFFSVCANIAHVYYASVESGLIYSIYIILDVVLDLVRSPFYRLSLSPQLMHNFQLLLDSGLVQIVGLVPTVMIVQVGMSQTRCNQTNFTTYKDDLESRGNTESRPASECNYELTIEGDRTRAGSIVTSPISIPTPMYRVNTIERCRAGYRDTPSSDNTRVGDVIT
jgi:hypothetical protein